MKEIFSDNPTLEMLGGQDWTIFTEKMHIKSENPSFIEFLENYGFNMNDVNKKWGISVFQDKAFLIGEGIKIPVEIASDFIEYKSPDPSIKATNSTFWVSIP